MKDVWREKISVDQYNLGIIPITDLWYGADFEFFNAEHGHGNRRKLFMFMGVAMLILVLACLNYLNLISAYAVKREHEVWIRKVHGASNFNITGYFLIESVLLSLLAWVLALLLSILGIRIFEQLMGIVISPAYFRITAGFGYHSGSHAVCKHSDVAGRQAITWAHFEECVKQSNKSMKDA